MQQCLSVGYQHIGNNGKTSKMSHTLTHTAPVGASAVAFGSRALAATNRFLGRTVKAMIENSPGAIRVRRVNRLERKSDAELAAMGIARQDIVRVAFQDLFYT